MTDEEKKIQRLEVRVADLETVLEMIRDNDLEYFKKTNEFRVPYLCRQEVARVLA